MGDAFVPGVYEHYKGGFYSALVLARLSEKRDHEVVVYTSLETGKTWVRPYSKPLFEGDDCWLDQVQWPDGVTRTRFRLASIGGARHTGA